VAIYVRYRKKENCSPRLPSGAGLHLTGPEVERLVLLELGSIIIERLMKGNAGRFKMSDSP
jgi:hypothetical protein